ncbi:MAG: B12-binding domain-containing radical SAM protein [Nanoarchaeota archaeon]|nr:B12-binding domain-containing radical SAM protein [Nanoarchaeota archaeon]
MRKKMKIVLISPPGNIEKTLGKLKKLSSAMPPMGLAYTAANLIKNSFEVEIVDSFASNLSIEQTIDTIKNKNPDIVGLSVLTPGAPIAHRVAKGIKQYNQDIKIIFGGAHAALLPEETLSDNNVDFVVRAEGEVSIVEIAKALEKGDAFENIKNISYRKSSKIVHNPEGDYILNLDELPFPAWHLLDLNLYGAPPHWDLKSPCFPLMASRGCPYRCTYCSLKTMGKQYRKRSVNNVVDEIEWLVNKFNAKEIMFMDAAFPLDKKWGIEICNELIKRDLHKKIVWLCETRVNHVDLELLKKMREAGCRRVAYGIESGVQELLNNIKKGFKIEQVREAIKMTKQADLEIIAYFMLGLPGETKELSLKTIEFAKELDADFVKFNLAVPYPGTEMYDQAVKEGTLKSMDWELYTSFSAMTGFDPVYTPKGMSKEDLMDIQKLAIRKYYFRPHYIIKHLSKMRSFKDISRDLKAGLSLIKGITNKKKKSNKK